MSSAEGKARIVFDAVIESGGTIRPAHWQATHERLEKWHGKHVTVTVEKFIKSKSNPQLRYFFGVVVPLWAASAGYEIDEMDIELRKAYFPIRREFSKLTGQLVEYIPRLSQATLDEMSAFLDRVIREAALAGIRLPAPEERTPQC